MLVWPLGSPSAQGATRKMKNPPWLSRHWNWVYPTISSEFIYPTINHYIILYHIISPLYPHTWCLKFNPSFWLVKSPCWFKPPPHFQLGTVDQVESCLRAYQLLRSKLDFPKEDIIFDCLLTPVGSEVPASVKDDQRKNGGQDLKCAVQWIKDSIMKMENSERPSTFPRVNSLSHLAC